MTLILSLFPGIGLLDLAFEEAGFCVVRGPDVLWGGDIRAFSPPAGRFDGVIGGPPCQAFSRFRHLYAVTGGTATHENLIPEFERVVNDAQPDWFLMENVPDAPRPVIYGYISTDLLLNNRWVGGISNRLRRFSFGVRGTTPASLEPYVDVALFEDADWLPAALASGGLKPGTERERRQRKGNEYGYVTRQTVALALQAQGLPPDFLDHAPFTLVGKHKVIGNGVPLPMGRALAHAVAAWLNTTTPKGSAQ